MECVVCARDYAKRLQCDLHLIVLRTLWFGYNHYPYSYKRGRWRTEKVGNLSGIAQLVWVAEPGVETKLFDATFTLLAAHQTDSDLPPFHNPFCHLHARPSKGVCGGVHLAAGYRGPRITVQLTLFHCVLSSGWFTAGRVESSRTSAGRGKERWGVSWVRHPTWSLSFLNFPSLLREGNLTTCLPAPDNHLGREHSFKVLSHHHKASWTASHALERACTARRVL